MKTIVAGSRSFNDYNLLSNCLNQLVITEIVSGTANGADKLGERYGKEKNIPLKQFPANWKLGKGAGYLRNSEMAEYGECLVAFWDGISKGTKHMIDLANKKGLKVIIISF